jgi:hypothetical protein
MSDTLPPLPPLPVMDPSQTNMYDYTAEEMREYARAYASAAVAAERERCAKVACDFLTKGRSPLGQAVAAAIRTAT